jgi:hypothetical protein
MLRSALLAGALALTAPLPAHAGAFVHIQTLWAVALDGMEVGGGPFQPLSGITVTPFGDAMSNGPGLSVNQLRLDQTLAGGSASYDVTASGGIRITNSNPANAGGILFARVDAGAGYIFSIGVDDPALESVSVLSAITATYQDSRVPCATIAGLAGVCICSGTSTNCYTTDYAESLAGLVIPNVGDFLELDFATSIHADLVADPVGVPEPGAPWGVPMLLGALILPYVRQWRKLL